MAEKVDIFWGYGYGDVGEGWRHLECRKPPGCYRFYAANWRPALAGEGAIELRAYDHGADARQGFPIAVSDLPTSVKTALEKEARAAWTADGGRENA